MNTKSITITYRVLTVLFFIAMLMDAFGGITRQEAGQEVMRHLGYPVYVLTIFGIAKLLGAIAILQNRFKVIKEWAYAGFIFNFIGAILSRAFVGDSVALLIPPVIMIVYTLATRHFWIRFDQIRSAEFDKLSLAS
jgi:hypothetical protein